MVRVSRRVGKNHFDKIAQGPSSRPTPGLHAPPRKASHTASDIRPLHLVLLPSTNLPAFADPPVSSPIIHFYRVRLNDFKSFDALSKVLFIFPSQYLFAIGLLRLFSLRRSLSPALCTSIKVHDSLTVTSPHPDTADGALTLFGGRLGGTSASGHSVRLPAFRSQFAARRTEITTVGFSRFRRPY